CSKARKAKNAQRQWKIFIGRFSTLPNSHGTINEGFLLWSAAANEARRRFCFEEKTGARFACPRPPQSNLPPPPKNSEAMNQSDSNNCSCCGPEHFSRRTLLKMAGMAGLTWLTPLGQLLALEAEKSKDPRAKSVIILWLAGGPSQLETFDPHPNSS